MWLKPEWENLTKGGSDLEAGKSDSHVTFSFEGISQQPDLPYSIVH